MTALLEGRARNVDESVIADPVPPLTVPMAVPLTIISSSTDVQIALICKKVDAWKTAQNSTAVIDYLEDATITPSFACNTLDLVGHSVWPENFLEIGDWLISRVEDLDHQDADPNDDDMKDFLKSQLAPKLAQLNIKSLRLLGCNTASTPAGFAMMHMLAAGLSTSAQSPFVVYGTNDIIFDEDFDASGFCSTDKLHPSNAAEPAPLLTFTSQSHPGSQLRLRLTPQVLRADPLLPGARVPWPISVVPHGAVSQLIWRLIEPDVGWSLPGLLTRPLHEVLMPMQSFDAAGPVDAAAQGDGGATSLCHRMQILLGHHMVRVFPSERASSRTDPARVDPRGGLLYKVKDPAALARLMSEVGSDR